MLYTVLRRRAGSESVEQIQPDLIIPTGKRKAQPPQNLKNKLSRSVAWPRGSPHRPFSR
ncbi:hypothetical protein ACFYXH_38880 [Streptomyces sp. NPDC002730]|uniref:hypothetical protein n=1 Tax=Streptomyces sp. NPDC002730 TaxID=3364662 RepID=UPI0036AB1E0A